MFSASKERILVKGNIVKKNVAEESEVREDLRKTLMGVAGGKKM